MTPRTLLVTATALATISVAGCSNTPNARHRSAAPAGPAPGYLVQRASQLQSRGLSREAALQQAMTEKGLGRLRDEPPLEHYSVANSRSDSPQSVLERDLANMARRSDSR
jgi:hypothetical protein